MVKIQWDVNSTEVGVLNINTEYAGSIQMGEYGVYF